MDLTDKQWQAIQKYIPADPVRADGRGRPWSDQRAVLNGILWILRTGARWKDLPRIYPPYQTVHRRFQNWRKQGVMERILRGLAEDLHARGGWDLRESFVDGTFVPAKKGATESVPLSEAKGSSSWQLRTAMVFLSPYAQRALLQPKSDS